MITEKELVGQLKRLRQIKPSNEWVSLNKGQLIGQDSGMVFFPYFKTAFATIVSVFIVIGLFGFVYNSIPGDTLYPLKKVAKISQAVFVSDHEKSTFQIKEANKRLDDLTDAPARNLAPTLDEFKQNIFAATKNLSAIDATTSNSVAIRSIIEETKKLGENIERIELLGVVIGENEASELYRTEAEYLIEYLETRSLTSEKQVILEKMKELFEGGIYLEALELYLTNQL